MTLKLGRDYNGNKILKASFPFGLSGFSVQTSGNLPETHRMAPSELDAHLAETELETYVEEYGTRRQKELLSWY